MSSHEKTNVMRILQQKGIEYKPHTYEPDATKTGVEIATMLGEDPNRAFKTLVTSGKSGDHYVFVIPVAKELDLKKAARAVSEKSISMLPQKELLHLTGYVHGGCSPIGMKKAFTTVLQEGADKFETIYFSAGKVGFQVEVSPQDLLKVIKYKLADVCVE